MRIHLRIDRSAALALALVLPMLLAPGAAPAEELPSVRITPGQSRAFRVALQRFALPEVEPSPDIELVTPGPSKDEERAEALRDDIGEALRFGGVLLPIHPDAFLGADVTPTLAGSRRYDCPDWVQSGADALVEGAIKSKGDLYTVEFAVWDTARCRRLTSQRYKRSLPQLGRLARVIADEVVGAFTGLRGASDTEIAFVSTSTGHREVSVMGAMGGDARTATKSMSIKSFPDWLPDGSAIVYTAHAYNGQSRLYLTSRGGSRPGPLLASVLPAAPKYRGVFGPKGDVLALVTSVEGAAEIFTVTRSGSRLRRLTNSPAIDVAPSWSPDGKQIAFVSDRSGAPQLYVVDRDGRNLRRLTYQGNYNAGPAWSPDGRWIAYHSRIAGQFDIWLIDPSGETNYPLVQHRRTDESPSWSPDSRKIAFSSKRRGRADLYVMDANGENLVRLTADSGDNTHPTWGPHAR